MSSSITISVLQGALVISDGLISLPTCLHGVGLSTIPVCVYDVVVITRQTMAAEVEAAQTPS